MLDGNSIAARGCCSVTSLWAYIRHFFLSQELLLFVLNIFFGLLDNFFETGIFVMV